ncbi:MAG: DUF5916 domain-containing protein [Gemmatimonadaceae bacterium]
MLLASLLLAAVVADSTYDGRANRTRVEIPRIESAASIDGVLDEPVWASAARLTGFSQYQPVDGRPAEEPTEVLVWYSPDAVYFGIRATELHGNVVRATKANRDDIASEDHIQILLDTNNDRQLAFLFGVNPLGVQQDGTRSAQFGGGAGGGSATGGGFRNINPLEGSVDLNPDYAFESKGTVVANGYVVEVRIPFKSLRYQDQEVQTWGIHVLRRIQHSGFQDTWAPAVRANANFLAQSGTLEGLTGMRRGLVLEATPTLTARLDGSPRVGRGRVYSGESELGGDARWGIRQNLTLNATINPDFSQVEADVGQVLLNERFALFYPEKRPFFLDGLELFDTPNQLIYTRRIAAPTGGLKLAGKLAGTSVAAMVVQDGEDQSWASGDNPLYGIARLRRDFGNYTVGSVLTAREDGDDNSRLAGADFRFYHSKLYWVQLQAAQSWSDSLGSNRSGSLLQAEWDRTGRMWGFHYTARALEPGFGAAAGFVNRTGIIELSSFNRLSFYGAQDALVQTYGSFFLVSRAWDYSSGRPVIETAEGILPSATLRGGWQLSGSLGRNSFAYDPEAYAGYSVFRQGPADEALPPGAFVVPGRERDQIGGSFRITTPTLRYFSATAGVTHGRTPIFSEAAPGRSTRFDGAIEMRPTAALRTTLQVSRLTLDRTRDDSRFSTETIPRIKTEYQVTRALFLRLVGQYAARSRSPLVNRDGVPLLLDGVLDPGSEVNELSMDWLFSYRPTPGTLAYFGYGSTMEEPDGFSFTDLRRTRDGFFGKLSYLVRF